ncbi:hypothetical protein PR003_g5358 [Phytophthora rubi]|uniref:Uncharacterized protein n=1 Tax=Phytophthora rubi TaxID=129364 RepID=A0A6A4FVM6_9STRA|nr:hypothetical protein PR003_g5358 [Phytophthora rubi]
MHGKMKKDSKVKLRAVLEKLAPVEFNQVRYSSSLPCMRKLVGGKCGAPEAAGGNNPVSQPDMSEAETPAAANCNECAVRKTRLVFAVGDVTVTGWELTPVVIAGIYYRLIFCAFF